MPYDITRLAPHHNRATFVCTEPSLTDYLQRVARQHQERNMSAVWVLTDPYVPEQILGYYTLSAGVVEVTDLPEENRRRYPAHPLPAIFLGRLAVHQDWAGLGLGKLLAVDAIHRAFSSPIGAIALVVDALHEDLIGFYQTLGFKRSSEPEQLRIILPRPKGW